MVIADWPLKRGLLAAGTLEATTWKRPAGWSKRLWRCLTVDRAEMFHFVQHDNQKPRATS